MVFKVSVIIPVFNTAQYLTRAVQSAISLEEVGEVIIIDDGSQDASLDVAKGLSQEDVRVKFMQHPDAGNHGPAASRNLGIKNSGCDFIAFLDSDDYYFTNRFSVDKLIFDLNDDVDAIYNCSHTVFESDVAKERYYAYDQSPVYTLSETVTPEKLFKALLFYWHGRLHTSAITVKREAFQKTGLFSESLRWAEDTELWLRLALKTKMIPGNITEPVSNRLIHDTNVSHQADKASFYKSEMYYSLFRWALDYGCTFENLNDIFNAHKKFLCQQGQLCSDKTLLMKYAKRFIGKITKPFFIKKLFMVLRA